MDSSSAHGPCLLVAAGARAAEEAVFEAVEEALAAAAAGGSPVPRAPVRVIVPSRSLRLHLAAAIVGRRRRPALGVTVRTLHGTAREILDRWHEPPAWGRTLADLLARRFAREEPELARPLEGLAEGYAPVAATVRDLLDAGLEPAHAEAADEALATDGPAVAPASAVARARALVRVAVRVAEALEAIEDSRSSRPPAAIGAGRGAPVERRAAALLAADPERSLPAGAVVVHGFADATGAAADLIEALLRHRGALAVLDLPGDPVPAAAAGGGEVDGGAFLGRLRERLAGAARPDERRAATPPPALDALAAATLDGEVRAIALAARAAIDAGTPPEAIGFVARDLAPYRLAIRRHFDALGVPFSGLGATGGPTPAGRRAFALLDLLRRGEELPTDRWLDAAPASPERARAAGGGPSVQVELRLALAALGAARLRDVAALEVAPLLRDGWYELPLRQGLVASGRRDDDAPAVDEPEPADDERDEPAAPDPAGLGGATARKRRVSGRLLAAAVSDARALLDRLAAWPGSATAAGHFARLDELIARDLGWYRPGSPGPSEPGDSAGAATVAAALAIAAEAVPATLEIDRDELRFLLEKALAGRGEPGRDRLGGAGGGVQALGVTEARGRTWERLFVAGVVRGGFPRTISPDPLLSDELRGVLARLIPDVPVKGRGFAEERYLFAHLLGAARHATVSWCEADGEGRPLAPSPLAERLAAHLGGAVRAPAPAAAAGAFDPGAPAEEAAERPAAEHAVLAGLHGPRAMFAGVLAAAVAERGGGGEAAARARARALDEIDPDLSSPEGRAIDRRLGPFFGLVGAPRDDADPRLRPLFVTLIERLAGCPWQVFLERVLRLEPTPDPLAALPGVSPLLLGNLVHRVLEEIAGPGLPEAPPASLAEAAAAARTAGSAPAPEPPWPEPAELEALVAGAARRLVVEEGVALSGLATALAERAKPFLEIARDALAESATAGAVALAVELRDTVAVADEAGRPRALSFRADRVEALPGGGLRLTDYKTGKTLSEAKSDRGQREHLLRDLATGRRLQAVAYALAAAAAGAPSGEGRYLFLKPEIATRVFAAGAGDAEATEAFAAAVRSTLAAWDAGAFFPRLVDAKTGKEPLRCRYCAVAEACLRHDSGARRRLAAWAGTAGDAAGTAQERALAGLWRLPLAREGR